MSRFNLVKGGVKVYLRQKELHMFFVRKEQVKNREKTAMLEVRLERCTRVW